MNIQTASKLNVDVYLSLSVESQRKVDLIYNIARELKDSGAKPITTKYFDYLYDLDTDLLMQALNHIRAQTRSIHY